LRGADAIVGQTTRVYIIADDLGAMIGFRTVASNSGGSADPISAS
jgi:hypothetical protein